MLSLCCPAYPYLFLQLKFIQLSWKRIIYEQICSLEWLVLFLLCWAPLLRVCWDCLSESSIVKGSPLCEKKNSCFRKHKYNYSNSVDIIIIPAQNIHCPISPKLLVRFCVSVVLFVLNRVFMSSHGRTEVTAG